MKTPVVQFRLAIGAICGLAAGVALATAAASSSSVARATASVAAGGETGPTVPAFDLQDAVVVATSLANCPEANALALLGEEVERRSAVRWPLLASLPGADRTAIVVGRLDDVRRLLGAEAVRFGLRADPLPAEGYQIVTRRSGGAPRIAIAGQDARGLLFGIGHFLRTLEFGRGRIGLPAALNVVSSPRYPIRGIQLGYRAMSNTYGGWDVAQFEQQIRDLAVFGCNVIELIVGSDQESAPEFALPVSQMRREQARLADKYGLDVWIVAPVRARDYTKEESIAQTLREWETTFAALPRLDGVFVPGGDPGSTPPEQLLPLLERLAERLKRLHPRASLWVSPQGFNADKLEFFFRSLNAQHPPWLTGVVSAPWTDLSTAEIRRRTPPQYAVVASTDIGHVLHCQQPLQDFDTALAITAGREPIAPRPTDLARLMRTAQPDTSGALAYSDGCNDDVNKILWLQLGWNPDAAPEETLQAYARYFVGGKLAADVARGIAMLERNWRGPLLGNEQVPATLAHFQAIERQATPAERRNWRLLLLLYRAYGDAYTQRRLAQETRLEAEAMAALARAGEKGAAAAMREAESILHRSDREPVELAERTRIFQLAEALFQTIHMKLSVRLYGATNVSRGANLDSLDWPLNNRQWLRTQFARIGRLPGEAERVAELDRIVHWTDPGPGGFYDDPGRTGPQPRVAPIAEDDPRFHRSAHAIKTWVRATDFAHLRLAWLDHVATLGSTPLELTYRDLDPAARYTVRVVYGDTKLNNRVRLVANGTIEIHPLLRGPSPAQPLEFAVPPEATRGGTLLLQWQRDPETASIKGVCHVSEIWLLKKT